MAQFQLKNWYFTQGKGMCGLHWFAHGNAYGNPKFPEGYHIHTSNVQYIEVREEALLVHTRHSVYLCDFCNCMERDFQFTEETELFLLLTADDLIKLKKRILDCRWTHQEQEDRMLRSMIPAEEDCFFMVFSDRKEYYFQDAILWNGVKVVHYSSYVHLGMFQNSVLINRPLDDGGAEGQIDFRYFHYMLNSLEFYLWEGFTGPVYAANQGERAMQVKTPSGTFQLPPDGRPYRINGAAEAEAVSKEDICMKLDYGTQKEEED